MKKRYIEFADIVKEQLDRALTQEDTLDEMSRVLAECIKAGGVLHVFGCGHSQMFGEELCFRTGGNAAGIDMALAAKAKGMKVIGVTSLDYSTQVTSRHSSGKMLKDVSDIVLDICGIKGDSVLYDERVSEKFCSTSTVVAMTLLVGVVGETIQLLAEEGINPPIWVSGNLDRGDEINKEHIKNYKGRVSIL